MSIKLNVFTLSSNTKNSLLKRISDKLNKWNGIKLHLCKNDKITEKRYETLSKNWMDQAKANIFAEYYWINVFDELQQVNESFVSLL